MKESLPIVTLRAVGILGSIPMSSSLLSPKGDKVKALEKTFLEAEEVETLLEECLAIQWVWSLQWTHLLVLKLAPESKLGESGDSPTYWRLS